MNLLHVYARALVTYLARIFSVSYYSAKFNIIHELPCSQLYYSVGGASEKIRLARETKLPCWCISYAEESLGTREMSLPHSQALCSCDL